MKFFYWVILLALLFSNNLIFGQIKNTELTTQFAKQINSIDDFFERFNFEKEAPFRKFLDKENSNIRYNRKDFLATVFNLNSTKLSPNYVEQFIKQVTDTIKTVYLNYNDHHWYAEITCKVNVLSKIKELKLVLMVEGAANKGYSWNVVAADAAFLKFKNTADDSLIAAKLKENKGPKVTSNKKFFLTPVSHGIDFTNLENIFINKQNIDDYIQTKQKSFELAKFMRSAFSLDFIRPRPRPCDTA